MKQRKIMINPDEYVIGSLYEKDNYYDEGVYDYYSLICPYDASGIEIDWQSDTAVLLINVGEERPQIGINESHFYFSERRDTNIYITKRQIIEAYNYGEYIDQPLENLELIFGIYTKYYDSLDSTTYSFRVHLNQSDLNIYKVSSDQKTICEPENLGDNMYRCLFVIIYEDWQFLNDLVVYAKSQSPSAITNMYADYLENEIYDSYNVEKLKEKIPNEDSEHSTKREKSNFIFLNYGDFKKNVFVSVISDKKDNIELYTSMITFENRLSPNPSSTQVYSLDLSTKTLNIDFITTKSLAINIISLYGQADIYLEKDKQTKYYLRGRDDNLELILPEKQGSNSLLTINNLNYEENPEKNYPGFIFLIEFNKRSTKLNLDEIKSEESSEISYKDMDFPVYYLSKLFDTEKGINVFFYLHDIKYTVNSNNFNREMTSDELIIRGTIIEEEKIFQIKKDGKIPEMKVIGKYDPGMQAGNIIISQKELKSNTFKKPTLYLGIEKSDKIKNINYSGIRGEIGFSFINGDSPIAQKSYQFGKIKDYNDIQSYKLNADSNTNYMRIQFSANSKYVTFSINDKPNERNNITLTNKNEKIEGGSYFLTFEKPGNSDYLYINIYLKENSNNDKLNNYVFKYINANTEGGFIEYKILNNKINIEINKKSDNKMDVTFNPIIYQKQEGIDISIIYRIKIVTNSDKIKDEYTSTISITESFARVRQYISDLKNDPITQELDNIPNDINYIQVIAQIKQGSIIEYVAYQTLFVGKDGSSDSKDNTTLLIGLTVGGILLIIIIILAIFVILYNRKNKDLLNQVNKISFVQSEAKDDNNLLVDNDNELD